MSDMKRLLDARTKAKKVKPEFVVRESHFGGRVKRRWRYPRGRHSATRHMRRGRVALVRIGYGSPKEVRGLHSSGLEKVVISTMSQLLAVDPKKQGIVIDAAVGTKKKIMLLQLAQKKKINVLSVKGNVEQAITSLVAGYENRKKARKEKLHTKSSKEEEKKKKVEEKKRQEEEAKKEDVSSQGSVEDVLQEQQNTALKEQRQEVEKELLRRQ